MSEQTESTELAVQTPKRADIMVGGAVTGGLVPQSFHDLWRLAGLFHDSQMMPKSLNTREKVAVAIQMGLEVGLSPMQAVQNIAVINQRPVIWGDAALGLVQASGKLEEFNETPILDGAGKIIGYHCYAKRKGIAEPFEHTFDKNDATRAELFAKGGAWKTYPQRMFQMRARAWTLRDGFADVLKGLRMAEEERDIIEADYTIVDEPRPLKAGRHDARKKPAAAPEVAQPPQEPSEPPATTKAPETPADPPKRKPGRPRKVTPEPKVEPKAEYDAQAREKAPEGPSDPADAALSLIAEIQNAIDDGVIPFADVKRIAGELGIADPTAWSDTTSDKLKALHLQTVGELVAEDA